MNLNARNTPFLAAVKRTFNAKVYAETLALANEDKSLIKAWECIKTYYHEDYRTDLRLQDSLGLMDSEVPWLVRKARLDTTQEAIR